jgi:hypothetical protein
MTFPHHTSQHWARTNGKGEASLSRGRLGLWRINQVAWVRSFPFSGGPQVDSQPEEAARKRCAGGLQNRIRTAGTPALSTRVRRRGRCNIKPGLLGWSRELRPVHRFNVRNKNEELIGRCVRMHVELLSVVLSRLLMSRSDSQRTRQKSDNANWLPKLCYSSTGLKKQVKWTGPGHDARTGGWRVIEKCVARQEVRAWKRPGNPF